METPKVTVGVPKTEVQRPGRPAKPPTFGPGRPDTRLPDAQSDHAAISPRSQAAAARTQPEELPPDAAAADSLARETSRRIVMDPARAAGAQAHSNGATVLVMLQ